MARYANSKVTSKLALGAARLGAFWQGKSMLESQRVLRASLALGVNFVDTADVYALGLSERLIGALPRAERERVIVCTKVGQLKTPLASFMAHRMQDKLSLASVVAALPRSTPKDVSLVPRCFEAAYVEYALAQSLRRLRAERVDIVLLHSPSLADLAARRFEAAAERILSTGDAAHFGVSCDTAAVARKAAELPYVSFVELPVDVLTDEHRVAVSELSARGVGVLARSPFGGGELARYCEKKFGTFDADVQAYCLQTVANMPGVFTTIVGMSTAQRARHNVALLRRSIPAAKLERMQRALLSGADAIVRSGSAR